MGVPYPCCIRKLQGVDCVRSTCIIVQSATVTHTRAIFATGIQPAASYREFYSPRPPGQDNRIVAPMIRSCRRYVDCTEAAEYKSFAAAAVIANRLSYVVTILQGEAPARFCVRMGASLNVTRYVSGNNGTDEGTNERENDQDGARSDLSFFFSFRLERPSPGGTRLPVKLCNAYVRSRTRQISSKPLGMARGSRFVHVIRRYKPFCNLLQKDPVR